MKIRGFLYILLLFILVTLTSCNDNSPKPTSGGLDDIVVPDGFTFNISEEFDITLKVLGDGSAKFDRIKFFVYDGNPDSLGVLVASGGVDGTGMYSTSILKSIINDSIYIASNITGISLGMVAVEGTSFIHDFSINVKSPITGDKRRGMFTDIISDFENGLDGWQPYRDNSIYTSDASNTPLSEGPTGSSDKFIWGYDTRGGLRSYEAPAKFSGDLYGQYLAFHYYLGNTVQARPTANNIADVRITDGNNVLAIDLSSTFQHEVNAGWQTIYCKLDETETSGSGWRFGNMSTWTTGTGPRSTPRTPASTNQIIQILQNVTGILIAPEYQVGYFSSNGPEFICLGKVGVVTDVTTFPIIQQGQTPNDSDGDGVPDSTDDYPDDPNKAYNNYGPGEDVYGTLAFEDLWPAKGDYDFNDLVIDYNYNVITNSNNKVVEIVSDYVVTASGAGFLNGFALELPVAPETVTSVIGQLVSGSTFTISGTGIETGQTNTVIPMFDDVHSLFGVTGFINTEPAHEYHTPVQLSIVVSFDGSFEINDIGAAPYNPFLVSNQRRGYEIHLAGHQNTDKADINLFGTSNDDTNPGQSKYYQTHNNLPWAIHFPVSFEYPVESTSIENAYLKLVEWAESGGTQFQDWYIDNTGYRNTNLIYQIPD